LQVHYSKTVSIRKSISNSVFNETLSLLNEKGSNIPDFNNHLLDKQINYTNNNNNSTNNYNHTEYQNNYTSPNKPSQCLSERSKVRKNLTLTNFHKYIKVKDGKKYLIFNNLPLSNYNELKTKNMSVLNGNNGNSISNVDDLYYKNERMNTEGNDKIERDKLIKRSIYENVNSNNNLTDYEYGLGSGSNNYKTPRKRSESIENQKSNRKTVENTNTCRSKNSNNTNSNINNTTKNKVKNNLIRSNQTDFENLFSVCESDGSATSTQRISINLKSEIEKKFNLNRNSKDIFVTNSGINNSKSLIKKSTFKKHSSEDIFSQMKNSQSKFKSRITIVEPLDRPIETVEVSKIE